MQISGLLPLNQNSQKHGAIIIGPCQKVVPLYIGLLTTVFLFVNYIDKNADHVSLNIFHSVYSNNRRHVQQYNMQIMLE